MLPDTERFFSTEDELNVVRGFLTTSSCKEFSRRFVFPSRMLKRILRENTLKVTPWQDLSSFHRAVLVATGVQPSDEDYFYSEQTLSNIGIQSIFHYCSPHYNAGEFVPLAKKGLGYLIQEDRLVILPNVVGGDYPYRHRVTAVCLETSVGSKGGIYKGGVYVVPTNELKAFTTKQSVPLIIGPEACWSLHDILPEDWLSEIAYCVKNEEQQEIGERRRAWYKLLKDLGVFTLNWN